jgi:hypothetical protein
LYRFLYLFFASFCFNRAADAWREFNLDRLLELHDEEIERTDAAEESINGDISSGPESSSTVNTTPQSFLFSLPWSAFSNSSLLLLTW